jgi:hypothetical protein
MSNPVTDLSEITDLGDCCVVHFRDPVCASSVSFYWDHSWAACRG